MNSRTRYPGLVVLALVAAACGIGGVSPAPTVTVLPADVLDLGTVRFATAEESAGAVSADTAINAAHDYGYAFPNPSAFLVVMTDKYSDPSGPAAIVDDLIWVVRWEGLNVTGTTTSGAGGIPVFSHAYVFVDARTGVVISGEMAN